MYKLLVCMFFESTSFKKYFQLSLCGRDMISLIFTLQETRVLIYTNVVMFFFTEIHTYLKKAD